MEAVRESQNKVTDFSLSPHKFNFFDKYRTLLIIAKVLKQK